MSAKIDYKKIITEIFDDGISQLNKEDYDFLDFCYEWHISEENDLSSSQKMTILKIRDKIK